MMRFVPWLALLLLAPLAAAAQEIEVRDAWIRLPPPGSNAAAYMTIENPGEVSRELTGLRSDAAARVELHRTVVEGDVARMEPVDALTLPAGGQVVLAPRGLHLMLIQPVELKDGDEVEIELELDGDEYLAARAKVRRDAPDAAPGHAHDHAHP